eukprot:TRINITY_DN8434_c0_g1_i1.p1 TRINITY_DN8434_c0_g1~~TRINITY_DN8434_c0_g1_i1.p1  ORF type:complete len:569 (+),score=105.44 TRINITY_DN8434_c0_g1_i1:162-1709(+)
MDGTTKWFPLQPRRGRNDKVTGEILLSFLPGNASAQSEDSKVSSSNDSSVVKLRVQAALEAVAEQDPDDPNREGLELDLTGCELSSLPSIVRQRNDWNTIDLSFNVFSTWPEVGGFKYLTKLVASANLLDRVPGVVGLLINLKILYLNGNQIAQLPDEIGNLGKLEKLDLANNALKSIPPRIGLLTKLEELNLSGNPLTTLPKEIGNLVYMQIMDLNGCNLETLPDEFPRMMRMLELNLGTNKLKSLPQSFGDMTRLVNLVLSDNFVTELPMSIGKCVGLKICALERNPCLNDPDLAKRYSQSTEHLVRYLEGRYFGWEQNRKMKERKKERKAEAKRGGRPKLTAFAQQGGPKQSDEDEQPQTPVEVLTPEEKLNKIKFTAQNMTHDIKQHIITLKRNLIACQTVEEALPIAQVVRQLKWDLEEARDYILPVPKPKPPNFFANESQVQKLKKTTAVALKEVEDNVNGVLGTLSTLIPATTVTVLARICKNLVDRLQTAPGVTQIEYKYQLSTGLH